MMMDLMILLFLSVKLIIALDEELAVDVITELVTLGIDFAHEEEIDINYFGAYLIEIYLLNKIIDRTSIKGLLLFLVIGGYLMNELKMNRERNMEIEGIGGWLSLLAVVIVLSPIMFFFTLTNATRPFLYLISTTNYVVNKTLVITAIIIMLGNFFLFIFSSYILYLFFRRKKKFPRYMIIFFMINLCIQGITLFYYSLLNAKTNNSIITPFMYAIVWSLYLTKSCRVKNTFKN
jgi:hypothetical protein